MKRAGSRSRAVVLAAATFIIAAASAQAGEIKVMTSGAFTAAYLELLPRFEQTTRNKLVTTATSTGVGADSIASRLHRGEEADVVIVPDSVFDELMKDGRIMAGSRIDLARSEIGMAVKAGAPKPDIRSVERLKRTLLNAKSIAYSASVSGQYFSTELVQRLGIAEQVLPKAHRIDRERVGAVVARGEAELGFQQVSELLAVRGIDFVGTLPAEVQKTMIVSAGVPVTAKNPDAGRAFIKFLASPGVASVVKKTGLEPLAKVH